MYRNQTTITIHIPIENEIACKHIDALNWYGKRTKIYAMFHEMLADIENFNYMDNNQLVSYGKSFVDHYQKYHILNQKNIWDGLKHIKSKLDELHENNYISERAISFVQQTLGYTENWEEGVIFEKMCIRDSCNNRGQHGI